MTINLITTIAATIGVVAFLISCLADRTMESGTGSRPSLGDKIVLASSAICTFALILAILSFIWSTFPGHYPPKM